MKRMFLKDFGILPDSGKDIVLNFYTALKEAAMSSEPCELVFEKGVYDAYHQNLTSHDIHISNTHSELGSDSVTRHSFMFMENLSDITVNGGGSLIRCHGKMTQISLLGCKNILFRNISFDYVHPTVTEMTIRSVGEGYIDCTVSPDSQYRIVGEKIEWYGENFAFSNGVSQIYDPETGFTWREWGPMQDTTARWLELGENQLRIYWNKERGRDPYKVKAGQLFQMRDPLRDECGILIDKSDNVSFLNVTMYFMNGLGFIAQNSSNIYLDGFSGLPSQGRSCACFADFMHFSGCRGEIKIQNGTFIGAHDDAINVHGTHLLIEEIDHRQKRIRVRFAHFQTKGIGGFEIGDKVTAADVKTLLYGEQAEVLGVTEISAREMILTLDRIPKDMNVGMVLENVSASADLTVKNNHFERIPTRGVLATTRGKVRITSNTFTKLMRCGVFIADDAMTWYESGPVEDVLIENNIFKDCGTQFLFIKPENSVTEEGEYVHKNIRAINNDITMSGMSVEVLSAKSCKGLMFKNNRISGKGEEPVFTVADCDDVIIEDNAYTVLEER